MTVTVDRPRAGQPSTRQMSAATPAWPGRRNSRRMILGAFLVLATVVVFWQTDLRVNADQSYLSVARPVPAGQVITDADLRVVRVANASGLALMPAAQRSQVVGRSAVVPLAAGSLLTSEQVGPVAWPPAGQAVIALPVKPGRAPAGLAAGARVVVLVVPPATAGGQPVPQPGSSSAPNGTAGVRRGVATVVSVDASEDQVGSQLVTLLLAADTAEAVASAPGDVSLVQLGPVG